MQTDSILHTWSRERLVTELGKVVENPDSKPSEIIAACREISRLVGHSEKPEDPPEPRDTLRDFIKRVRNVETPDLPTE